MQGSERQRRWMRGAALLALVAVSLAVGCDGPTQARSSDRGPRDLQELESRVNAAWPRVHSYRTVERLERLSPDGKWEPVVPPLATDYVLPDRKYQRPAESSDNLLPVFVVVGPTVYQQLDGQWTMVDPAQIPGDSPLGQSFQQLRTHGLAGSPFRVPPRVEGKLTGGPSERLDGRECRWYHGTANGPNGPMQLRIAIEEGGDLPCSSEAEFAGPQGRARQAIRYFDYNAPLEITAPAPPT